MDSFNRPMQPQAASLAHVAPFMLGPIQVEPSLRRLSRGERNAKIEPRTMRVLVALAKPVGVVLSRDDLIDDCWDGVIVGDGAVNRAISQLRRTLAEMGDGHVRIETISKVAFRLITDLPTKPASLASADPTGSDKPDRRKILPTGVVVGLLGLAVVLHHFSRPRPARAGAGGTRPHRPARRDAKFQPAGDRLF